MDAHPHTYAQLREAFVLSIHGVLTSTTREEFVKFFPKITPKEQDMLYSIFTQVVAQVHEDALAEFQLQCDAAEVMEALSELEQFTEQHVRQCSISSSIPPPEAVREKAIELKMEEVKKLEVLVPLEEEKNQQLSQRLERLHSQALAAREAASVPVIFAKVQEAIAKLQADSS